MESLEIANIDQGSRRRELRLLHCTALYCTGLDCAGDQAPWLISVDDRLLNLILANLQAAQLHIFRLCKSLN